MSEQAVALYGKMLAFSRLKLTTTDHQTISTAIKALHSGAKRVPVIVDLPEAFEADFDLAALVDLLWSLNLGVIGVIEGKCNAQADKLKLSIFPADGNRIVRLGDKKTDLDQNNPNQDSVSETFDERAVVAQSGNTTPMQSHHGELAGFVHEPMVRSGQAVHYLGGDLIITSHVNHGAEAVTDGNLHIYGKGQGRLVAGATGDEKARIFCQNFDPSLVSVAGMYCLKEDIPTDIIGKAVQVSYSKEKGLVFTLMKH